MSAESVRLDATHAFSNPPCNVLPLGQPYLAILSSLQWTQDSHVNVKWIGAIQGVVLSRKWDHFSTTLSLLHVSISITSACTKCTPHKPREHEASGNIAHQIWLALSADDILGIQGSLDHVKWSVHVRAEISSAGRPFLKSVVYPCQIAIVRFLQTLQTYSCLPKLPHIM